jgi:hypothetical protein
VNENQGAESTLSFLLALLEMRAAEGVVEANPAFRSLPMTLRADDGTPAVAGTVELVATDLKAAR